MRSGNRKEGSAPRLRRNIISGMILAVGNTLTILVSYPLYLKYLGMELYGLWATLSIVVSFTAIGRLGIDTAMIKFVAEECAREDQLGIKKYFSTAIITLLIVGSLILLVLLPLRKSLVTLLGIPEGYISLANVLLPSIVLLSVLIFLVRTADGTLRGLGRVDLANYYDLGGRAVSIAVTVFLLSLGYGVWSLFWGQVLLYILLGFVTFLTIYGKLGASFFSIGSFDFNYLKRITRFGGTITAAQIISMLLIPFNKVVIARYISLSAVTYFEIANRAVSQLRSVFVMGLGAIMPEISRLSVLEDAQDRIDSVLKQSISLVVCFGVPLFTVFFLLGTYFLRAWISDQYVSDIGNAFRIILVGYLISLLAIPLYYLFMGIGRVRYCFAAHMIQAVFNAALIFAAILLGVFSFYLCIIIYSASVTSPTIVLIVMFFLYQKRASERHTQLL